MNDVDAIPTIDAFVIAIPTETIFPTFISLKLDVNITVLPEETGCEITPVLINSRFCAVYPVPGFVIVTDVDIFPEIIVEYPTCSIVAIPTEPVLTPTLTIPICGLDILTTVCVPMEFDRN